jgi:hypothetical protein
VKKHALMSGIPQRRKGLSEIDVNSPRKAPLSAKPAAIRSAAVVVATGGNRLVSSALSRTAARPVIQGNRHISSSAPAFVSSNLCTKYPHFGYFCTCSLTSHSRALSLPSSRAPCIRGGFSARGSP